MSWPTKIQHFQDHTCLKDASNSWMMSGRSPGLQENSLEQSSHLRNCWRLNWENRFIWLVFIKRNVLFALSHTYLNSPTPFVNNAHLNKYCHCCCSWVKDLKTNQLWKWRFQGMVPEDYRTLKEGLENVCHSVNQLVEQGFMIIVLPSCFGHERCHLK